MNVRITLISAALLGGTLSIPMVARAETPASKPEQKNAAALAPAVSYSEGIQTPESVLYEAGSDTYLVSNINGSPLAADNNGFISRRASTPLATRAMAGT